MKSRVKAYHAEVEAAANIQARKDRKAKNCREKDAENASPY